MEKETEILDLQAASTTEDELPDRDRPRERISSRVVDRHPAIRTKDTMLDLQKELGTGIGRASLTLIEGHSSSGKSVLCQHLAFGALVADSDVVYFTSEHFPKSFSIQMASIGLGVSNYLGSEKLSVRLVGNTLSQESPELVAALLLKEVQWTPSWYKIVIVLLVPGLWRRRSATGRHKVDRSVSAAARRRKNSHFGTSLGSLPPEPARRDFRRLRPSLEPG